MFLPFSENGKCFYPLNARTSMNADDDMKGIMYTNNEKNCKKKKMRKYGK